MWGRRAAVEDGDGAMVEQEGGDGHLAVKGGVLKEGETRGLVDRQADSQTGTQGGQVGRQTDRPIEQVGRCDSDRTIKRPSNAL